MRITINSEDLRQAVLDAFQNWDDYAPEYVFRKPPLPSLEAFADSIVAGAENKGEVTE